MATVFLSDVFRELFTKKTCIYLSNTNETFNENCVIWETKYFFRKEVYSSRGKLRLESTSTDENVDVKDEIHEKKDFKQSTAVEKLRPILKMKENENMKASRVKAIMKSKMNRRKSARSNGEGNVKHLESFDRSKMLGSKMKVSEKSKILSGTTTQKNFIKFNADRNNTKKNDSANAKMSFTKKGTSAGKASNVDQRSASGRNASQLGAMNSSNKHLKTDITELDNGVRRKEDADAVSSDRNRKTKKSRTTEGQVVQSEKMNTANRTNAMNAVGGIVRADGTPHMQSNNLNEISGLNLSEATSKITRAAGLQHINQNQNTNTGEVFNGSANSNSYMHVSFNAYAHDQSETAYTINNQYGVYVPSQYGVRSSFPIKCDKTNLVFDERQKTLDFTSQCTENSILEDENTASVSDNKVYSGGCLKRPG